MVDGSALVLAAHGSGDGSEANRVIEALAGRLGDALGRPVRVAFWKGTPSFREVAGELSGTDPVILPVLAADGHYARRVLPDTWAEGDPSGSYLIAPPLGALPSFTRMVEAKVDGALRLMRRRSDDLVVLLIGHGTRRNASSGEVVRDLRDRIARAHPGLEVQAAFIDEEPLLEEVAVSLSARELLAVPLMVGGGPHMRDDLVGVLRAARGPVASAAGTGARSLPPPATTSSPTSSPDLGGPEGPALEVLPPLLEWAELADLLLGVAQETLARVPLRIAAAGPTSWGEVLPSVRERLRQSGTPTLPASVESSPTDPGWTQAAAAELGGGGGPPPDVLVLPSTPSEPAPPGWIVAATTEVSREGEAPVEIRLTVRADDWLARSMVARVAHRPAADVTR